MNNPFWKNDINSELPWLPKGKRAALCFTIDDIHPGTSTSPYEAGGDLDEGALGLVRWLLHRHPQLRTTLFVTPDWRRISVFPTRKLCDKIPYLRDRIYLAETHKKGTMSLCAHPEFVDYINAEPQFEVGIHGLHHIHKGRKISVEFQDQSFEECNSILQESLSIFEESGIRFVRGMTPPGWNVFNVLLGAMVKNEFQFIASARDLFTPITQSATNHMDGLRGVSIIRPQWIIGKKLLHFPTNIQATSSIDRVFDLVEQGGLVSIKAHIIKRAFDHIALDGVDQLYMNHLDVMFSMLEDRYSDSIWWTSMGEINDHIREKT